MLTPRPEKRAFVDEITLDSWASWIGEMKSGEIFRWDIYWDSLWLCQHCYGKSSFSMGKSTINGKLPIEIDDLPIEMVIFNSYVKLPEGILRLSWRYHNKKGSWDIMECNVVHCEVMAWDIWGGSENGHQSSPWVSMLSHDLWLGWFEVPWSSYLLAMKEQSYFGISNHIIISVRGSSDHSNRHSQYFAV